MPENSGLILQRKRTGKACPFPLGFGGEAASALLFNILGRNKFALRKFSAALRIDAGLPAARIRSQARTGDACLFYLVSVGYLNLSLENP
jgi:hypothetical protein